MLNAKLAAAWGTWYGWYAQAVGTGMLTYTGLKYS
jgi:hypothetical protein